MSNELSTTNVRLNADGNQIINEVSDGGGKTQTIKYGLIKLIGDKQERRVSFRTLLALHKAQDDEVEAVMIKELNMTVKTNQIVMLRSETENIRVEENITKLPTDRLFLDSDLKPIHNTRGYLIRNCIPFYEADVHYAIRDDSRQYYLEFDKIQKLLEIVFKDDYPVIRKIYEYGIEK